VLAALVVVAALVAGGLAVASAAKPSYPVPELQGKTLAEARRIAGDKEKFHVVERSGEYREDVATGLILAQSPLPNDQLKEGSTIRVRMSKGPKPRAVPDLTNKNRGEVQQILDGLQLVQAPSTSAYSDTVPKDVVVDWNPKTGTVPRGGAITVTYSKGKEPKDVPSLVDRLYDDAVKVLTDLGFTTARQEVFSDKVKAGNVVATTPSTPAALEPGSQVTVVVSKGPEQVEVPNLAGLDEDTAAQRLEDVGLHAGDRFGPPRRKVFATLPRAGTKVDKGSSVDLYTG
jgi:serine/threonine-protein kinase